MIHPTRFSSKSARIILTVATLLFAVAFRIAYLPVPGMESDILYFDLPWGLSIHDHGLFSIYEIDRRADHPIISTAVAGLAAELQIRAGLGRTYTQVTLVLFKLIPLFCELGIISAVVLFLAPPDLGRRLLVGLALAAHPGLIITTVFWGQTDSVYTIFVLFCLIALQRGHIKVSWLLFALGLLAKFQAIVILPLLFMITFKRYGWKKMLEGATTSACVFITALLPFFSASGVLFTLRPYLGATSIYPFATVSAFNFWYLVTPEEWLTGSRWDHNSIVDGPFRLIGLALFGLYVLLICVSIWRHADKPREFIWAGALYFGFFMLPTQMHERYLYPAVIFLLIGALADRRLWLLATPLAFTFTYNVAAITPVPLVPFYWLGLDFIATAGNISLAVAVVNMLLLAWTTVIAVFLDSAGLAGRQWRSFIAQPARQNANMREWHALD